MQFNFDRIKPFLTRRNIIIGVVSILAVIAVIASFYLPGVFYRGYLPITTTQQQIQPVTTSPTMPIVTQQLSVSCNVSPNPAKVGEQVTWTATASGGSGGYDFEWIGHNSVDGKTTDTFTTTYSQAGSVNGTVFVYSGTDNATATCNLEVESSILQTVQPSGITTGQLTTTTGPLAVSCAVSKSTVTLGEAVTYSANVSGGGGGYQYKWIGGYFAGATTKSVTYTFPTTGDRSGVYVSVESSDGSIKSSTECPSVTVTQPIQVSNDPEISCNVTPTTLTVGEKATWTATVVNGDPPFTYQWAGPVELENQSTKEFTVTMLTEGMQASKVIVKEGTTVIGEAKCPVMTVKPEPIVISPPGSPPIQIDPGTLSPGTSLDPLSPGTKIAKITAYCSVDPAIAYPGDTVVWSASVENLDETDVTEYAWSGAVVGNSRDISAKYSTEGKKESVVDITYAKGTVTSDPCVLTILPEEDLEDQKEDTKATTEDEEDTTTEDQTADRAVQLAMSQCPGIYYPLDIQNHWAEPLIIEAYDKCWVKGYADNTFRPDTAITRAEAAKIVLVAAGVQPNLGCYDADCGSPFIDLDMWQGPWIRPAYDAGIVEGYSDISFGPNRYITRAEASSLVTRAFGIQPHVGCYTANCGAGHPDNIFTDIYDFWQGPYIRALWDAGIVQGTAPYRFEPNRPISRAELLKMAFEASSF